MSAVRHLGAVNISIFFLEQWNRFSIIIEVGEIRREMLLLGGCSS